MLMREYRVTLSNMGGGPDLVGAAIPAEVHPVILEKFNSIATDVVVDGGVVVSFDAVIFVGERGPVLGLRTNYSPEDIEYWTDENQAARDAEDPDEIVSPVPLLRRLTDVLVQEVSREFIVQNAAGEAYQVVLELRHELLEDEDVIAELF